MKILFTPSIAYRFIKRAKDTFIENKLAPEEWKAVLKSLPIYVCISRDLYFKHAAAYGVAWSVSKSYINEFVMDQNEPTINVSGTPVWPIIEFDAQCMVTADSQTLYNLVSHELSHCLDYGIRGRTKADDHDSFFETLNMFMGGQDRFKFPCRQKLQTRIDESIESFGGERVVAPRLDY